MPNDWGFRLDMRVCMISLGLPCGWLIMCSAHTIVVVIAGLRLDVFQFKDRKKPFSYPDLLRCTHQLADALRYLHDEAIPGRSLS